MTSGKLLGDKLQFYRKQKDLTQAELAKGICHKSFISKFETNRIQPTQSTLQQLKERLEIQDIPLTNGELEDFKKELCEWGTLIKNGVYKKTRFQYNKLYKTVYALGDTELVRLFLIPALKLHLADNKPDAASHIWAELLTYEPILSGAEIYYFYYYGGAFYATINDSRAVQLLQKAIELDKTLNINDSGLYYALCNYYMMQDRVIASFFYCELALHKIHASNVKLLVYWLELLHAFNYSMLGQHQRAIKILNALLIQAEHYRNDLFFYNVHHTLGCVYTNMGSYDLGYKAFLDAFAFCEETSILSVHNILHIVYLFKKSNDNKEMSYWLTKGLDIAKQMNYSDLLIQLTAAKYISNLKNNEALSYVEDIALPYLIHSNKLIEAVEYSKILAQFYFNKHNFKKAYQYAAMATTYTETIYKGEDSL